MASILSATGFSCPTNPELSFMRTAFLIFMLFLSASLAAQVTGSISGRVADAGSDDPLPGANVFVEGTFIGASTDVNGQYVIKGIAPGEYLLKAGYIGYKTESVLVRVEVNRVTVVDLALQQTALLGEQVVVTGSRQPENLASA
ncbi:carboxypeptidase-like regulatory domain-containing protein, partial [candidate division KSB1 bacterium]